MRVSEEQQERPVRMNRWSGKSESDKNKEVNRTTSYPYVLKQNNFIPPPEKMKQGGEQKFIVDSDAHVTWFVKCWRYCLHRTAQETAPAQKQQLRWEWKNNFF